VIGTLRSRLGLDSPLKTDDRRLLEGVIIPFFRDAHEFQRILFVGCDFYTTHYERLFGGKEYWTLDKDPGRAKYGAPRHVVAPLSEVDRHFTSLDVILVNGVLGWGLDDAREAEESFAASVRALRPGGILLLGWNDTPERLPLRLEASPSLLGLEPYVLPPLGVSRRATATPNRHTFSFFRKPAAL
jgi:SAM-dependent methyltransferase